jgi:hypothetical protein
LNDPFGWFQFNQILIRYEQIILGRKIDMNRRYLIIAIALVFALTTMACELSGILVNGESRSVVNGSGNVVEETRPVIGVTGVDLATFGDVIIQLGEKESLRVEAEDNLIQYFETDVRGGTLHITTTPRSVNIKATKPVRFFLTVKGIEQVSISGSGDIQVPDLETDQFSVNIGGSGDVSLGDLNADKMEISIGGSGDVGTDRVKVQSFQVRINGSGDISLGELSADDLSLDVNGSGNVSIDDGQVGEQEIRINGSGDFRADDLASKLVDVRIGGSGDVTVWVMDSLDVRIMGSGNVRYYGRPAVSTSGNGSGNLTSLGDK